MDMNVRGEPDAGSEPDLRALLTATQGPAPTGLAARARVKAARVRARRRAVVAAVAVACLGGGTYVLLGPVHGDGTPPAKAAAPPTAGVAPPGSRSCPGPEAASPRCPAPPRRQLGTINPGGADGSPRIAVAEGIEQATLAGGMFGHYPSSALPGAQGNVALAAGHGNPVPLDTLRPGTTLTFRTGSATFTYTVDASSEVAASAVGVTDPVPQGSPYTGPGYYLTLTAPSPGDPARRTVVFAHQSVPAP